MHRGWGERGPRHQACVLPAAEEASCRSGIQGPASSGICLPPRVPPLPSRSAHILSNRLHIAASSGSSSTQLEQCLQKHMLGDHMRLLVHDTLSPLLATSTSMGLILQLWSLCSLTAHISDHHSLCFHCWK